MLRPLNFKLNKRFDIPWQLLPVSWSHVTYGKVSESLPFVPLIFPLLSPSRACTSQEGGAGGGVGGGGKASADLLEMRAVVKETQLGAKEVPVLACRVPETGLDYLIICDFVSV
jgi:hypothetical protein